MEKHFGSTPWTQDIMFDINSVESYNNVHRWHEQIKQEFGDIPIVICGNKIDAKSPGSVFRRTHKAVRINVKHMPIHQISIDSVHVSFICSVTSPQNRTTTWNCHSCVWVQSWLMIRMWKSSWRQHTPSNHPSANNIYWRMRIDY